MYGLIAGGIADVLDCGAMSKLCLYDLFFFFTDRPPPEISPLPHPDALRLSSLARLPSAEVCWVDEHLLVIARASHCNQVEPDGPGSGTSQASRSGPSDQRRARR